MLKELVDRLALQRLITLVKNNFEKIVGDDGKILSSTLPMATTSEPGVVQLSPRGGIKYSNGLTVATNANYGTTRTGDGKVVIAAATEADIDAATNVYKPITPATAQYTVEKYASGGGSEIVYSETPVRIGTWIDGTPVWRQAFNITFTEEGMQLSDRTFGCDISVTDGNNAQPINSIGILRIGTDGCIIDDWICEHDSTLNHWHIPMNEGNLSNILANNVSGAYGYIDFATPESNIKTTTTTSDGGDV